ncbi:histidinol-phosphatase [candidate division GN15 bacterium]|nr:histidinol-phosphatase [candidate division GN15 bacterium]
MPRQHGDWWYYSGVIHVHTTESDGTKTLEEVAKIGEDCGCDFLLFADHMTLSNREAGKEGYHGRCLVLIGYEHNDVEDKNHFLVFDSPGVYPNEMNAYEYVAAARRDGALGIMAHPDEVRDRMAQYPPYEWTDWSNDDVDGIELWNQMSEWMERLTKANRVVMIWSPRKSMYGPTERVFRKWDELNLQRKCVGIASADAHAFPVGLGPFTFRIFPYKTHFRTLRTHLILPEPLSTDLEVARRQVYGALRDCRAFGSNIRWGDADAFEFYATGSSSKAMIGGQLDEVDNTHLHIRLADPADLKLVGNGRTILETTSDHLDFAVEHPGIYRVEAWKKGRCWIFSNHIRIGSRSEIDSWMKAHENRSS